MRFCWANEPEDRGKTREDFMSVYKTTIKREGVPLYEADLSDKWTIEITAPRNDMAHVRKELEKLLALPDTLDENKPFGWAVEGK
jgi:hypothetical protein